MESDKSREISRESDLVDEIREKDRDDPDEENSFENERFDRGSS